MGGVTFMIHLSLCISSMSAGIVVKSEDDINRLYDSVGKEMNNNFGELGLKEINDCRLMSIESFRDRPVTGNDL